MSSLELKMRAHQPPPSTTSPNTHVQRGCILSLLLTHLLCFVKFSLVTKQLQGKQFSEIYNVGLFLSFFFLPVLVTLNHENFHEDNSDPEREEIVREETRVLLCNKQGDCNLIKLVRKNSLQGDITGRWTLRTLMSGL